MNNDRSRTIKTQAIVLRRVEYSEADFILTLLTPHHGKISAIAKGVRRPTSKLSGHVELYHHLHMLLRQGRNLHIVSQVELRNPFLELGVDLEHIGYASHFAELIDRFTIDNEESTAAFYLLLAGLKWLTEPEVDLRLAARYFEIKLLEAMGYAPALFVCAMSGEQLAASDHFYSAADGGVIAYHLGKEYRQTHRNSIFYLPLAVFKILRHFMRHEWPVIRQLQISAAHHATLEQVLHATIAYVLERNLQSIAFLKQVASLHTDPE
jgi:DNA repair protein RecO (recombination protein O)